MAKSAANYTYTFNLNLIQPPMNTTSTFGEYALISDPVDRGRVAQLEPLFLIVKSAKGTGTQGKVLAECATRAGMTRKTFQNQYYNYIHFGVMGVADKRVW